MTKPFLTIEEQIAKIMSRNMKIKNVELAKEILLYRNYYNIINAYDDIFILKNESEKVYRENNRNTSALKSRKAQIYNITCLT